MRAKGFIVRIKLNSQYQYNELCIAIARLPQRERDQFTVMATVAEIPDDLVDAVESSLAISRAEALDTRERGRSNAIGSVRRAIQARTS